MDTSKAMEVTYPQSTIFPQSITFCGLDGMGLAVENINVWSDYERRNEGGKKRRRLFKKAEKRIVDTVRHGETGTLLVRYGDKCKVRTKRGKVGFVTYWFIKELKQAWLNQQALN